MLSDLGRRIERLMYFGALLLVACALQIYMVATVDFIGTENPAGFSDLANKIEHNKDTLQSLFDSAEEPRRATPSQRDAQVQQIRRLLNLPPETVPAEPSQKKTYSSALNDLILETATQTGMRVRVLSESVDVKKSPDDLIKVLRNHQSELEKRPVVVWGIEAPVTLPFQYGAAQYQVPNWVFANLLFIALIPLCVGWLGSIYFTRQRELFIIRKLDDYKRAFPHILNILPVIPLSLPSLSEQRLVNIKSKNRGRKFNRVFYSLLRSFLILLFALPMVSTIIYSAIELFFVKSNPGILFFIVMLIVTIILIVQITVLIAQEWLLLWGRDFTA